MMRRLDGKHNSRKGTFKDLTGSVFGRLTVLKLERTEDRQWARQKATVRFYLCRCNCGKEKVIASPSLTKDQRIRSCGCLLKETKKTLKVRSKYFKEGTAFRKVLAQYKYGASTRGLSWELTDEEFKELTASSCYFTGKAPSRTMEAASGEVFTYNGVDRIDSAKGYTTDNCVPCCTEVNFMKRNLSYDKFIGLCKVIAERF